MKHEFSLLLRCANKALAKQGSDSKFIDPKRKNTGVRHAVTIKKEKILTLASSCEYVRVSENMHEEGLVKGQVADKNIVMNYAKEYGIVAKDGKQGWKYFNHKSPTLVKIEDLWAARPMEYYRTQQEIIERAKTRLAE